jgi:hypothetical protein
MARVVSMTIDGASLRVTYVAPVLGTSGCIVKREGEEEFFVVPYRLYRQAERAYENLVRETSRILSKV